MLSRISVNRPGSMCLIVSTRGVGGLSYGPRGSIRTPITPSRTGAAPSTELIQVCALPGQLQVIRADMAAFDYRFPVPD